MENNKKIIIYKEYKYSDFNPEPNDSLVNKAMSKVKDNLNTNCKPIDLSPVKKVMDSVRERELFERLRLTQEDQNEFDLQTWRNEMHSHRVQYQSTLNQIAQKTQADNFTDEENFNNTLTANDLDTEVLNEHLHNVFRILVKHCKEPRNKNHNISFDEVIEVLNIPIEDKQSPEWTQGIQSSVLKALDLFAHYKFKDFNELTRKLHVVEQNENSVVKWNNQAFLDTYLSNVNNNYYDNFSNEQKKILLQDVAKTFLNEMGTNLSIYKRNYAGCINLLADACEPIASITGDSRIAMAVGLKTFINVYPILKQPGMFKLFAGELFQYAETNFKNYEYRVQTVQTVTNMGYYALKAGSVAVVGHLAHRYLSHKFAILADVALQALVAGFDVGARAYKAVGDELEKITQNPNDF